MLPVSPRKIFAGWKLYRRKPKQDAQKIKSMAASSIFDWGMMMIQKARHYDDTAANPDARPSRPSMRLKALIMPIHHNSVRIRLTQNGSSYPMIEQKPLPNTHNIPATTTWTASLIQEGNSIRSSTIPSYTISRAEMQNPVKFKEEFPEVVPEIWEPIFSRKSRKTAKKDMTTAIPPPRGVGFLWACLPWGISIYPSKGNTVIQSLVRINEITRAAYG